MVLLISGNELIHYNPQEDQDSILTLFDLGVGETSNDSINQPVMNDMPSTLLEGDQDTDSRYIKLETPSLFMDDSSQISTEDVD